MNDLRATLDDLASDAPLHRADWGDVVRRSRRTSRIAWPRKRLLLALAIVALLAVAGTAIGVSTSLLTQVERFHAELPDDPNRTGPSAEITGGGNWALVAWQSDNGICLDFAVPGNAAYDCDFPVRGAKPPSNTLGSGPPVHAIAGFISFPKLVGATDSETSIFGVAEPEVASVEIELRDGSVLKPPLYAAPPELNAKVKFFIARLDLPPYQPGSGSPVRFYKALNRDGALIERVPDD
jgi:hypothetical protein